MTLASDELRGANLCNDQLSEALPAGDSPACKGDHPSQCQVSQHLVKGDHPSQCQVSQHLVEESQEAVS